MLQGSKLENIIFTLMTLLIISKVKKIVITLDPKFKIPILQALVQLAVSVTSTLDQASNL